MIIFQSFILSDNYTKIDLLLISKSICSVKKVIDKSKIISDIKYLGFFNDLLIEKLPEVKNLFDSIEIINKSNNYSDIKFDVFKLLYNEFPNEKIFSIDCDIIFNEKIIPKFIGYINSYGNFYYLNKEVFEERKKEISCKAFNSNDIIDYNIGIFGYLNSKYFYEHYDSRILIDSKIINFTKDYSLIPNNIKNQQTLCYLELNTRNKFIPLLNIYPDKIDIFKLYGLVHIANEKRLNTDYINFIESH